MKKIIVLIIFILTMAGVADAIELKATPIQDEIKANMLLAADDFAVDNETTRVESGEKKLSMKKGVVYSILVPGWGEYYTGHRGKAKYFFAAEILTWIGYVSYRTYGKWKEDDMIRFAREYANADIAGKDDTFRDMVGFYSDLEQYNSVGRFSDQDRAYLPDTPENHWHWQSDADREAYRALKNRSREAYRNSDFMIGVAIVNRIISVLDTIRDIKRANSKLKSEDFSNNKTKFKIDVDPLRSNSQIKLTFYPNF